MIVFPLTKDKKPACSGDWRNYRGKPSTDLVGVMIPNGVMVIDVDSYKGVSLEAINEALGCDLDWPNAELQSTQNGGKHYVFKLPGRYDITNGANLLGIDGLDARASGKGYIATGKGYTNLTFQDSVVEALHDVDFWPLLPVEAALKLCTGQSAVDDSDDEMAVLEGAIAAQPLDLTGEEIEAYMASLPDDCANDGYKWLKVMMAVYHQFQGSDEGYAIADAFSQRCPEKYNEAENRKRWKSFGKKRVNNPVTFASIIEMAGGKSVVAASQLDSVISQLAACTDRAELDEAIKAGAALKLKAVDYVLLVGSVRKAFKTVTEQSLTESAAKKLLDQQRPKPIGELTREPAFFDDFVYLTSSCEYMHRDTKTVMPQRGFDVAFTRITPLNDDGQRQLASSYVMNRIDCVHAPMYAPGRPDFFMYDGVKHFNTYRPNDLKATAPGETVERVKRHVAHLLVDPWEQELFISYLAHAVQYPGHKIFWAIVLQGVQGDGKSFFAEMMQGVMGRSNCKVVSAEVLDEHYSAWAEGSCLTIFEELKIDNYKKYETVNKLKPYITNPVVSVRKMYRDSYEALNTANYIGLTNHKDALPLDDTDRRYCVLFSQWQDKTALEAFMAEKPDYYPGLYDAMRNNLGELLGWLSSYPIPDWFMGYKRAPETKAKAQMRDLAKGDDWALVEDAIEVFKDYDINDFAVNVTKLQRHVSESMDMDFKDFPKTNRLKNIMFRMGYHAIGRYKDKDRKNQTIYCKDKDADPKDFSVGF